MVIERIKAYFEGSDIFKRLVANAVKKRTDELPKLEQEIGRIKNEMQELADENRDLVEQLLEKSVRTRPGFMDWLAEEVDKIKAKKQKKEQDLAVLLHAQADLMKKSGLENLQKTASEFIQRFDEFSGVEKRDLIERMIHKIVIRRNNQL